MIPSRLEIEEESPNRFNLEHLIPRLEQNASPNQFTLEHLIRSRLPGLESPTRALPALDSALQATDTNPTSEEWVRRFLEDRWNSEKNDWWGNSSGTEGSTKDQVTSISQPRKRGHRIRNTNKTLNQQDFWRHFSQDQKEALGKMMASRYADPVPDSQSRQASGTGLSPVAATTEFSAQSEGTFVQRQETTPSRHPKWSGGPAQTQPDADIVEPSPKMLSQVTMQVLGSSSLVPSEPVRASAPRMRKKVLVKGKGCVISIPHDIPRGSPGYPPKPMTKAAVDAKLKQYEQQGFDISGFSTGGLASHNRAIWPAEADVRAERVKVGSKFPVRVARESEWKDYVDSLLEAKLAALGVSVGGEEDIPLPMSRQTSSQQYPGLPFSPPLPSSSAGSHRMGRQGSIVSGHFPHGPSPGHMSRQSIASPGAFANPRASMHMHRHSTFASPANFAQHAISPSGTWSPGGYFGSQDGRGSPALPLSRPDLSGVISPRSPFGLRPHQQFPVTPSQKDDFLLQMQMQQQQLQAHMLQQQQQQLVGMRPSSTLAEVPEDEDEEDEVPAMKHAAKSATVIAVPTPRGHHHNISENLEREAANEEYHLEEAIDKQFAEGGDFSTEPENHNHAIPLNNAVNSTWEDPRGILHQPQPHSRAHSLAKSQQPVSFSFPTQQDLRADSDGVQIDLSNHTNPSLEEGEIQSTANSSAQHSKAPSQISNSWRENKFAFSKPSSTIHSKHTSRASISKLNVDAKEFKFNPAASFNPGALSAGLDSSLAEKSLTDTHAPHSTKVSVEGMASFNVAAPVFKPDAPAFTPTMLMTPHASKVAEPSSAAKNMSAFPSSGFSFSSPPTFKPDAPVFNPGMSALKSNTSSLAPTSFSSEIFGDVNISANDIVKPASRSKAVPIVRPDLTRQKTPEVQEDREDESGRPMQADGREKRARRGGPDGDDVPKFALQPILASQHLAEANRAQATESDSLLDRASLSDDKENRSPDSGAAKPKPDSLRIIPQPLSAISNESDEPLSPLVEMVDTAADDHTPHSSNVPTPTAEVPSASARKHGHASTLSANAKPFEFRPQFSSTGYDFGFHVTKPSQVEELDKSISSPPRSNRSPATTFRPSDDGSYKTALESGRHAPYPESESVDFDNLGDASFNDIDAVMKHMNEEGSDFGVERDENSWEHSSPQRTPHEFDRSDLQPSFKLRSDAPSPSPRRLYAAHQIQGSATSNQDPFDDERAGLPFDSPVHRLNNADDVPMSDWDEGLLTDGEDKIQARSGFFDKHVNDLMGRLLQNRLGPLEQNLQGIQDMLASLSQRSMRGRRSLSTNEQLDSDADDEDDDVGVDAHYRNRSPRKDKRLEKIRTMFRDALESHQSHFAAATVPVATNLVPETIREIVTDVLVAHQPPTAHVQPASVHEIRAILDDAIASTHSLATKADQEHLTSDIIRISVAEALTSHEPKPMDSALSTDNIRSIVMEALSTHVSQPNAPVEVDLSGVQHLAGTLKEVITDSRDQQLRAADVRDIIEDALKRQNIYIMERKEGELENEKDARIAELEDRLQKATLHSDAIAEAGRAAEAREADTVRLLKVTEEELSLLQQAAGEDEARLRALKDERDNTRRSLEAYQTSGDEVREKLLLLHAENEDLKMTNIALETSEEDLKQRLGAITAENEALVSTLEQHRLSADKWRDDLLTAQGESDNLRKVIDQTRCQAEEATRVREYMRTKFERLQQDMVVASQQVATERAQWQKNEEVSSSKYEVLSARIEAEGRTRERLERELERLEVQEREGMKLRIHFEQAQKHNARLEDSIEQLRRESSEHQKNAERHERDAREARDAAHVEIRRTRVLMDADIDAANNQVNVVRHELESEIARVRSDLDQVRLDSDTAKEKHELDLEAASDVKKQAVHEAHEGMRHLLQEQQHKFERQLELVKHEHVRAIQFGREDKERAEAFHNDKLALADSRLEHFQDKISLLEEKLQVAKEAARAAVAAASGTSTVPSLSSGGHEKISPQALRESIAVLQEQLQEREGRIESLERQLEDSDTEAPAKLKERNTEINWLRELLGVRVDDLNDLINSLAQPTFDRETVRDAAIRIRTNLQMEQSEKERLISGGQQTFPTLSTLSNFASPKAVQLAAAFGNWRSKGRGEAASALAGGSGNTSRNQTPSRAAPHSAQSFLSGLMTPPTSNMRRTPDLQSTSKRPQNMRSDSSSSHASTEAGFPSLAKQTQPVAPRTPPLMRKANYDQDAEPESFSESGFYDDESTIGAEELTSLALDFGRELSR